jgi:predicted Rossmann fold flavoprotein
MTRFCDVAVIGAGAAGLATAIFSGRTSPGRQIVVLDGARKPGAKILVSGGGRCNVTNSSVSERDFWGGRGTIVRRVLRGFPVADTIAFFRELGVPLHEEPGGKLFPDSNRARDVLEALLRETDRVGAQLLTDHRVLDVSRTDDRFVVQTSRLTIAARVVVLAAGGQSLPKSGSDGAGAQLARRLGHTIVDTTPALAPLRLGGAAGPLHARLSGVTHDAELTLWIDDRVEIRIRGPLLWTHFGISGPVALDMSRHWARAALEQRRPRLTLNFCPGQRFEEVEARLVAAAQARPRAAAGTILGGWLPASLADAIAGELNLADIALSQRTRDDRRRLTRALIEWPMPVDDTRGYTYAEATAGGVALGEIDPSTMASRVCPGLFLVGEVLDVDGRLGGFNFQWAWASARAAARGLSVALDAQR